VTREPFLRTRAGRLSLLAMLVVDVFIFTVADYPYFSITTMTSVGLGDALPRTTVTRAIAMAQALTGQLYAGSEIFSRRSSPKNSSSSARRASVSSYPSSMSLPT
jgi:hypothetical protein